MLFGLDIASLRLALRQLVAIRGPISLVRSDRGTNFVAAAADAPDLDLAALGREAAVGDMRWELLPAAAPHAGGVWERPVGLVKRALDGALAKLCGKLLTVDELTTLLQEAAAVVNRTPLWSVSSDPTDPAPLSPAQLLTLKQSPAASAADLCEGDLAAYGPRRWRRVQWLADAFWRNWRLFYLTDLHRRNKWRLPGRSLRVGDVVLLRDRSIKHAEWPAGIIEDVFPGSDGLVRRVAIRVAGRQGSAGGHGRFLRPVGEVVLLLESDAPAPTDPATGPAHAACGPAPAVADRAAGLGDVASPAPSEPSDSEVDAGSPGPASAPCRPRIRRL